MGFNDFIDDSLATITPGGGDKVAKTTTETKEETKVEVLSYLKTLELLEGERSMASLESDASKYTDPLEQRDRGPNAWAQLFTAGFAGRARDYTATVESSGWNVKHQDLITKWDKVRYAIAIKEIGAWSYQYVQRSGFVSVPFRTPKPIRSVSLQADEIIPRVFNAQMVNRWIRYWLSFNNNDSWVEIAPANEGATNLVDGLRLPQVVHVNSGIPQSERDTRDGYIDFDNEASLIRLKCIMERPSEHADMTPVLKGYRLRIGIRSSL